VSQSCTYLFSHQLQHNNVSVLAPNSSNISVCCSACPHQLQHNSVSVHVPAPASSANFYQHCSTLKNLKASECTYLPPPTSSTVSAKPCRVGGLLLLPPSPGQDMNAASKGGRAAKAVCVSVCDCVLGVAGIGWMCVIVYLVWQVLVGCVCVCLEMGLLCVVALGKADEQL
jgi:hypothetical protein